jgi:phage shock protein A
MGNGSNAAAFERLQHRVLEGEAVSEAHAEMASDNLEERLQGLDREDRINRLLAELKARHAAK